MTFLTTLEHLKELRHADAAEPLPTLTDTASFEAFAGRPNIEFGFDEQFQAYGTLGPGTKLWKAPAHFNELVEMATQSVVYQHNLASLHSVVADLEGVLGNEALLTTLASSVSNLELGPAENPDQMLRLYDLIPDEWIGPGGREQETSAVSERIAVAVLSTWMKHLRAQLVERRLV